ncbi:DEAD/DEAH box helicase family protein [Gammaproteobacteria bacterium]|nr:DEAD/DEAH box helicase family protein [Gammaproteobacteria bacterium]
MAHPLDVLLDEYRNHANSKREQGNYFERLVTLYLSNDPVQQQEYEQVWTWGEWANEHGWETQDLGIDLVAKLRGDKGFAAIQAKFYNTTRIQKVHIDSFISASGKEPFRRRIIVDTSQGWATSAEEMIRGQAIPVTRLGLSDMRESPIDWNAYRARQEVKLKPQKTPRPDQLETIERVVSGLQEADRGKMIMACGTGKTFTSLRIAEHIAGRGGRVLFMVPSLALMDQAVKEWVYDANITIHAFAACSDSQTGKRTTQDEAEIEIHDLAFPATTDPAKIAQKASDTPPDQMTVVFATYQSIETIKQAQASGLPEFDLIICDEAHRTTGATLAGEDESNFVKIHDNANVSGRKRLYMTATPRIYDDSVKSKAGEQEIELASMDDEGRFGKLLEFRSFGWAVEHLLLTDYKVIVLAMDESKVSAALQSRLASDDSDLQLDDATKIIGCYKALIKEDLKQGDVTDPQPVKRALAFCQNIKLSKRIRDEFSEVTNEYLDDQEDQQDRLNVEIEHVDGTFNAKDRRKLLHWLEEDIDDNTCRILSNARCLSEGVDVPALDAILFMHPRKSHIDIVQSVGRVMRRAPGKRMGYVILPIGVPAGLTAEAVLSNNEKFRVIWQILNALRAHDERLDGKINQMALGQDISDRIQIVYGDAMREVTAEVGSLPSSGDGASAIDHIGKPKRDVEDRQTSIHFDFALDEFTTAIKAQIVKKCGTRDYWEDWSKRIADIATSHISRLQGILAKPNTPARQAFDAFLAEIRDDLNDDITEDDAIEMLAQHVITRPVFETLFEGHHFTKENSVSRAMQGILETLDENRLDKESQDLDKFYKSVSDRAQGLTDPAAKQQLIVQLYDKFFRNAFPRTTERLGIVYTPVEVVDFIIHSVNDVLQNEFSQTLGSEGVHIIDPFTGTGTFITRLLQSGLIAPQELQRKYREEIHANEIVLLAYYIAAINIEAVYHGIAGGSYIPFDGICLTDTFQMYEKQDDLDAIFKYNSARRKRQVGLDIRVIMGNPPYSAGQTSANDNNANTGYSGLDKTIRDTYAAKTQATLKNALYDSYIRAIRWGSDRLKDSAGVMAYVTNAGWIDGNAMDGLRAYLAEEFSNIYIFHLRGNARTSGEQRQKEKGNVFGEGSRAPIAITIFVKNPDAEEHGKIYYHDIGDYLSQQEKLDTIRDLGSINGLATKHAWKMIAPNQHHDWINQRDDSFEAFIKIGDKKTKREPVLFKTYSSGIKTNRDAWCYNTSKTKVEANIERTIAFYNSEVERYRSEGTREPARGFVDQDPQKISWDHAQYVGVERGKRIQYQQRSLTPSLYRPFTAQWAYFNREFNNRVYLMPSIFPGPIRENFAISLCGIGGKGFSALMCNTLPDIQLTFNGQCFPLRIFSKRERQITDDMFSGSNGVYEESDGISDAGLNHFRNAYPGEQINKEDIFYYVYGLLHSPDYRERFADNLSKELPRIPCVKTAEDFWHFSCAGRELGELHVNYESVELQPVTFTKGDPATTAINDPLSFYRVTKMKHPGNRGEQDKTTLIYNSNITITGIPLEAYDYIVNGKPALAWIMERQSVKTEKNSGITNDANDYANETMDDPAYPLKLFQRVITVSLETMKIVDSLPELDIDE